MRPLRHRFDDRIGKICAEEAMVVALRLMYRDMQGGSVISLDGRIVLGEETSILREAVGSLLHEGKKNIVLDMKNVSLIDSSGLGILVSAYSSAKARGASLRLCNLGSRLNELLQVTKLYTVFEVSDTVEDAVCARGKRASADQTDTRFGR